ncbi:MAG: hydantoinase B/oxoprolinase family protein, partial [Planctomycetes bacterium]|nr:hydantoinase B/oxoprolinase family protein [Planctomycetota bacterium]
HCGPPSAVDAIQLELFNNHFASIAEQMGATLQKTALSTNVKERLDFSCAIFTAQGDLVVNAPHIPVHLGAMSECVKRLIEDIPDMRPGEVYLTNDPFRGGSHLPDVTVVTPVFAEEGTPSPVHPFTPSPSHPRTPSPLHPLLFFTASRAHHAEIGGITPGSVPPFSKCLAEEGVLIRHFRLVQHERSSEDELRRLLNSGAYPSRSVNENVADINAQVAANQVGVAGLLAMVERYGLDVVRAYMGHIQRAAEYKMRAALLKIPEGEHRFTDSLDDGSPIAVTITVRHVDREGKRGGEAAVDFTGTGPVIAGNLNANSAIVSSAVIYCFRCLIDEQIPLNAGILAPIEIRLPRDCLLNPPADPDPTRCPAVVGGNVETSQRVVDCIFGALGVAAASQGTMNNFIFGRSVTADRPGFGYYETICGGSGAGPTWDGADAVHTHMTNTRLTDPEVLEDRYPVRLRRFEIRRGSGGAGKHKGGDGIIREIEFIEPAEVSLLTSRRTTRPYGLADGQPGAPGRNLLISRVTGQTEELPGAVHLRVEAGDVLRIETPGGGGWGTTT